MKQKTIGLNPLEEYLSSKDKDPKEEKKASEVQKTSEEPKEESQQELASVVEIDGQGQLAIKGTRVPEVDKPRPSKQRITLHISAELVDRVKNAVYWEPGLTVAGFAEEAFSKTLAEIEEERGAPFPQRKQHRLRGGRPLS